MKTLPTYERSNELTEAAQEKLDTAIEVCGTRKPRDIVLGIGGIATATVGEVFISGDARIATYFAGGLAFLCGAGSRFFKNADINDREKGLYRADLRERVATVLPKLDETHTMKWSVGQISLESVTIALDLGEAKLSSESTSHRLELYEKQNIANQLYTDLTLYADQEQSLAIVLNDLVDDVEGEDLLSGSYFAKKALYKASLLDKYLPISADDEIVPVDHESGQKSWLTYAVLLSQPENMQQRNQLNLLNRSIY